MANMALINNETGRKERGRETSPTAETSALVSSKKALKCLIESPEGDLNKWGKLIGADL